MSFFEEISPFLVLRLSRLVGEKAKRSPDRSGETFFRHQTAQAGGFLFLVKSRVSISAKPT